MKIGIVGGGPAGIMSAITAAKKGHRVTIVEKNNSLGNKLNITGKGRCNITYIGDDEYFLMGDNRDESYDSRRFGPVPEEDIVGKVWFRGWPFSRVSFFEIPNYNK